MLPHLRLAEGARTTAPYLQCFPIPFSLQGSDPQSQASWGWHQSIRAATAKRPLFITMGAVDGGQASSPALPLSSASGAMMAANMPESPSLSPAASASQGSFENTAKMLGALIRRLPDRGSRSRLALHSVTGSR